MIMGVKITTMRWKIFRPLALALLLTLATSCDSEVGDIGLMCEEIATRYPAATLQDVYKTCYQDFFGAEHLVSDTAAARMYLHKEIEECRTTDMSAMPDKEPTGFRHRFERINLSLVIDGEMSEEDLFEMFIDAAGNANRPNREWWQEWRKIEHTALQVHPQWDNPELQASLMEAAKNGQAVRHSDSFREAYNPHYRIVRRQDIISPSRLSWH